MIDWLKNMTQDYPEFWKKYISKFNEKTNRFVVLSTETSGLNPDKDVILALSCIAVQNNMVVVGDSFEVVLKQYIFNHDNGFSNEFIIESKQEKFSESIAIEAFIDYLGNAILIGHHINFDLEMINKALRKNNCGTLKNEALDIEIMYKKWNNFKEDKSFSIEELQTIFKLPKTDRISAADDAFAIALLFLKLQNRLGLMV